LLKEAPSGPHNGHDPAWFVEPLTQQQARERLGLPSEHPIAVYAGHVNLTKGLDTVFRMAEHCPDILFLIVGASGRGLTEWLGRRRRNVQFITWRPFREVKDYLYAADVLLQPPSLIPLRLVRNTILPMKLFLYLAAGRPILAPHADDTRELLRHGENAWLVEAGQLDDAIEGIRRLVRDHGLARQLSLGALGSARGLTWDARAEKLERFIGSRLANYRTGHASRLT
jgi:glycosyltransferase involved in cell wall biosynthesis